MLASCLQVRDAACVVRALRLLRTQFSPGSSFASALPELRATRGQTLLRQLIGINGAAHARVRLPWLCKYGHTDFSGHVDLHMLHLQK